MVKLANYILSGKFWWLKLLALLVLINVGATYLHTRFDLTSDKRFTLSRGTKKILKELKTPVDVNVFLDGNLPSGFRSLRLTTQDLLTEFKEMAGANINFHFTEPTQNFPGAESTYGDTLTSAGYYPINLTLQKKEGQEQQYVFPYALVTNENRQAVSTLYKGRTPLVSYQELSAAENLLEYQLASSIAQVADSVRPIVAYATGNGEPDGISTYDLVENVLAPNFRLFTFNLATQPFVPQEFQTLIIAKPIVAFTDAEKFKLDQYVTHGGNLFICLDKLHAEADSLQSSEVVAYDRELQLNDLLFKYGARVNSDLVMDLQCDFLPFVVNGSEQFELLPWNYYPVMDGNNSHPITKVFGFVSVIFVNSIDLVENEGIKKTVLLQSSSNARTIGTPAIISARENETAPQSAKYNKSKIPMAVLLEGKFESLYNNRLMQWMKDSLAKYNINFSAVAPQAGKIVLVADGDIILNGLEKGKDPIPMGMNQYTYGTQREFPFANREFVSNTLAYMADKYGLSEAKSREYVPRLLDTTKVNDERTQWQIINILGPVFVMLLFAFIYNYIRRRKYT